MGNFKAGLRAQIWATALGMASASAWAAHSIDVSPPAAPRPLADRGDGFVLDLPAWSQPAWQVLELAADAARLGARHILIPMHLCQDSRSASRVEWCFEHREKAAALAEDLKLLGISHSYLPFLLLRDGAWRGEAEPADWAAWLSSYRARLDEILTLHNRTEGAEFILGTELSRIYLAHPDDWKRTLRDYRARTRTPVMTIANWDQWDRIRFWGESDAIGLSSYYPVGNADGGTVEELTEGWTRWKTRLVELARREGRPLYFAELGYPSVASAAAEPWNYASGSPADPGLQARLFEAFGRAWAAEPRLGRFTVWGMTRPVNPATDVGYGVFGKPAEAALARVIRDRIAQSPVGSPAPQPVDVLLTMDDFPMWFVNDLDERLDQYARLRRALARRGVPVVAFLNPGSLVAPSVDAREVAALREWRESDPARVVFANHTALHSAIGPGSGAAEEAAFWADFEEGARLLHDYFPGWNLWAGPITGSPGAQWGQLFRFPNGTWGSDSEAACRAVRARGFAPVPVSFHSGDHAIAPDYHAVSAAQLEDRPEGGAPARREQRRLIEETSRQLGHARARFRPFSAEPHRSPLALILHSTRLTRDTLEVLLLSLERQGVRWVLPDPARLGGYAPENGGSCLPRCKSAGACF
ncbi:MAG: hypothetical protein IT285_06045 [Bdellovibrionales bacterium]|nr:hypothetical protein [Bdellovibrionales bacterium]